MGRYDIEIPLLQAIVFGSKVSYLGVGSIAMSFQSRADGSMDLLSGRSRSFVPGLTFRISEASHLTWDVVKCSKVAKHLIVEEMKFLCL
eukprot:jgi/Botrbrau1/10367/Bobra.146_2s0006.1